MRVMHFVTGGFSGATQVAIDLCRAAAGVEGVEVLLVLRRKRTTTTTRVEALRAQGVDVRVVPGWTHAATVWTLRALARAWRPDILVAHGYSEHLWGRYAGLLAGVPQLVHVEHNSRERYTRWRLAQALWLARRTAATVGVSEGVREQLVLRGFPAEQCVAIPNGIDLGRFPPAELQPMAQRESGIVMAARFARQKDHATLIEALALLVAQGLRPVLYLAGGGKPRVEQRMRALAQASYPRLAPADALAIAIPALVISGQNDLVLGQGPRLAQALGQGQYVEVPGADHFSLAADPGVKAAVARFMRPGAV